MCSAAPFPSQEPVLPDTCLLVHSLGTLLPTVWHHGLRAGCAMGWFLVGVASSTMTDMTVISRFTTALWGLPWRTTADKDIFDRKNH